jgi:hypothetical protein
MALIVPTGGASGSPSLWSTGSPAAANESEDRIMPHTKEADQRKRRTKAVPVLGAAGLSFSLATGAPAAVGNVNPDPATSALVAEQVMDEEQISDVSLAMFHVLDNEGGSTPQLRARPTVVSQGRLWGRPLFASESASGQRAYLSGTAIAQASADPSREQIQTLVAGPWHGQIEYLGLSQRNVTE